ncbi:hypothetical protein Bca52824_014984 [Brassica carinata]|uniref:Small ribosomal subunit protein uS2 n=1 Tax=Brassica carinata TaxID=52824 RepID=A0A8X7W1A4_BRACI|nr:hypothetical protein Bca52824_014984 [Brassica carinata]
MAANGSASSRQLSQKEADIKMMCAAEVHLGTKNCNYQMERYVFKRRNDGIYIFNLGKTWEKLQMAARVIVAIENPQDIIVQSARPYGQRAVLKFAQYTGANAIAGRHTPGTFTNQMQTSFSEPRLLILTDPRTDHQPIKEGALGNIPIIAFCDTDSPMRFVDIGIPPTTRESTALMRGTIRPAQKWDVMVDLFFYREPEEAKPEDEDEVAPQAEFGLPAPEYGGGDQWTTAAIPDAAWREKPRPISAAPAAGSWNDSAPAAEGGWDTAAPQLHQ